MVATYLLHVVCYACHHIFFGKKITEHLRNEVLSREVTHRTLVMHFHPFSRNKRNISVIRIYCRGMKVVEKNVFLCILCEIFRNCLVLVFCLQKWDSDEVALKSSWIELRFFCSFLEFVFFTYRLRWVLFSFLVVLQSSNLHKSFQNTLFFTMLNRIGFDFDRFSVFTSSK